MEYSTSKVIDKKFFKQIRSICSEITHLELTEIEKINKPTKKNPFILNFGLVKKLRLDCISQKDYERVIKFRLLLEKNNINISKLLSYNHKIETGEYLIISEWIYGDELHLKLKGLDEKNKQLVLISYGELIGKMSSIKVENFYVLNTDIGMPNIIVTEENKLIIVDHQKLRLVTDTQRVLVIVKLLLKRIKRRAWMNLFLEGYGKYFDIKDIVQKCDDYNWLWVKRKN